MPATEPAIEIELPFPPSVNTYWRHVGNRTLISKRGRQFKEDTRALVIDKIGLEREPLWGRLSVEIALHPPTRRKFDVDNFSKAVLDALESCGVYANDSQIDKLAIARGHIVEGGACVVRIWEVG